MEFQHFVIHNIQFLPKGGNFGICKEKKAQILAEHKIFIVVEARNWK